MAKATEFPGMSGASSPRVGSQNTAFPGMVSGAQGSPSIEKAIMGFLVSVSRTSYGEFWPVYVGPNNIGRGPKNDINLQEKSVSAEHAQLVVRQMMKNGEKNGVLVFVKDNGSMYGTQVNGETLGLDPMECNSGDIITVGSSYELLFIQVDAESLGLKKKDDFVPTNDASEAEPWAPQGVGFKSNGPKGTQGMENFMSSGNSAKGTMVADPSAQPAQDRPGTAYMPAKSSVPKF